MDGLPGRASMRLRRISRGDGRFGPMGCVLIFRRMSSIGSLES